MSHRKRSDSMKSDAERCAEYERFKKIDAAFRAGDLDAGADPRLRTRIDDCETPREIAEKASLREIADLLARRERF
jgi:hypothetical protein